MIIDTKNLFNKGKKKILTAEQELFCQYYTMKGETFSNGLLSYALAYGYDFAGMGTDRELDENNKEIKGTSERERAYKVCESNSSRNLHKDYIRQRIQELLIVLFNDDNVFDAKVVEISLQGKDSDAINAIKHRNDLKQRITKKLDLTTAGRPMQNLSDEELERLANSL